MKLLFELSKEHKSLPLSEVKSCLKGEKINFKIVKENLDVLIVELDRIQNLKNLKKRISMAFYIDEFLFSTNTNLNLLEEKIKDYKLNAKGSIALKYKNKSKNQNSKKIIQILAKYLTENRKVNLEKPDIEIRVIITDKEIYLSRKIFEIDRSIFEKRKVQYRPFFSPITLHPKIARALVNLSSVKKGQILLDPFCGTGGILLEAGIIGINIIGSDIEKKMINGSKKTLDYYNIKNYKFYISDIGKIFGKVGLVDAVVTDFPYGKSTTTKGEDIKDLYERAFESISKIIKNKARAVIGLSDKKAIKIALKYLKHVETHELRVHKSLTRYFIVLEK